MPLSDHEQRLLEQIERALYAEDPKFASTVRLTDLRYFYRRRMLRAALVFIVGVAGIVAGALLAEPVLLAAGIVVALAGGLLAASAWRRFTSAIRPPSRRTAGAGRVSFKERMQERWERRFDERNL